jgi:hypothetical protein
MSDMRKKSVAIAGVSLCLCGGLAVANPPSPYAGQEDRAIKALSAEEVRGYLEGSGRGFALAAELNRYPGPAHVLELAASLDLSAQQKQRTLELFAAMQEKARRLGRQLVDEETNLDMSFASRAVTKESLHAALELIGVLQSRIRQAHLEAHLEQIEILSPAQSTRYAELRGYGTKSPAGGEHEHGGHRGR